jgi:hypothetical protein
MSTQLELKEENASRGGVRVGLFIPFPEEASILLPLGMSAILTFGQKFMTREPRSLKISQIFASR